MERAVIHLNVADFAVAVERLLDPALKTRAVVVAPVNAVRAVVHDMSEEAFKDGVRKQMPLLRALARSPKAVVLPPRPRRYHQAMADLVRRVTPFSPLMEPGFGDGHVFVDVTGVSRLFGPAVDVAWRMRKNIFKDLGLAPIWSVAPNKLVAKTATRLVKPLGEYVVGAGEEAQFMAPVPLCLVPGIERADLARFADFNLTKVGQAADLTLGQLGAVFGKKAGFLFNTVRGIDFSPVCPPEKKPPKITRVHDFSDDTNDPELLGSVLFCLAEKAGAKLRARRMAARRAGVILDFSDGARWARQASLRPASAHDPALFKAGRAALENALVRRVRVRRLTFVCDRLVFPPIQTALFQADGVSRIRQQRLSACLDAIRGRFGHEAVQWGRALAAA